MNERMKNSFLKFPGEYVWVEQAMGESANYEVKEENTIPAGNDYDGYADEGDDDVITDGEVQISTKDLNNVMGEINKVLESVQLEDWANQTAVKVDPVGEKFVLAPNATPLNSGVRLLSDEELRPIYTTQGLSVDRSCSVSTSAALNIPVITSVDRVAHVANLPIDEGDLEGIDKLHQSLINAFVDQWMKNMGLQPFMDNIIAEDELGRQMIEQLLMELWKSNDNGDGTSRTPEIFLKAAKVRMIERVKEWIEQHNERNDK